MIHSLNKYDSSKCKLTQKRNLTLHAPSITVKPEERSHTSSTIIHMQHMIKKFQMSRNYQCTTTVHHNNIIVNCDFVNHTKMKSKTRGTVTKETEGSTQISTVVYFRVFLHFARSFRLHSQWYLSCKLIFLSNNY